MGNIITTAFEKVLGRQPSHHLADNTSDVTLYVVEVEMVCKQHIQPVPECTYCTTVITTVITMMEVKSTSPPVDHNHQQILPC